MLPLVTEMLNSHNTMRLLKLSVIPRVFLLKQEEKEMIQNFYDSVLRHPSLQYVGMYNISLEMNLKEMVNTTNKHKLPIINVRY